MTHTQAPGRETATVRGYSALATFCWRTGDLIHVTAQLVDRCGDVVEQLGHRAIDAAIGLDERRNGWG